MKLIYKFVTVSLFLNLCTAEANIRFTPVAKNADGSILTLDHQAAIRYCADRKMRLPTPREWAIYAQSNGAKGIRDTRFPNVHKSDSRIRAERDQMRNEEYFAIIKANSSNQPVVDFYYNETGYRNPSESLRRYRFWTSSVDYADPRFALSFASAVGTISSYFRHWTFEISVRCVIERR